MEMNPNVNAIYQSAKVMEVAIDKVTTSTRSILESLKRENINSLEAIKEIKTNLAEIFGDKTWKDLTPYEQKMAHMWYGELKKVRKNMNDNIETYRILKKSSKHIESLNDKMKASLLKETKERITKETTSELLSKNGVSKKNSKEDGAYLIKDGKKLEASTYEKVHDAIVECVNEGKDPTERVQSILANG